MANLILLISMIISFQCVSAQLHVVNITSILEEPYLMLRQGPDQLIENGSYEGFVVDLIQLLSQYLNFGYRITHVQDQRYGSMSKDRVWNGMIGELLKNVSQSDIAIGPLTMTAERAEVVDFSMPFMEFQLRMVMKRREASVTEGNDSGSFVFLRPFSGVLWATTGVSVIILTLLLYTIELYVPRRLDSNPGKVKFCLNGVIGSPRTVSGRLLQFVFWIFVVILTGAYIAAFTGDRMVDRIGNVGKDGMPIESIEELAGQTEVKYGVVHGGSTYAYFKNSWERMQRKMFAMIERESVPSQPAGYDRVRNDSNYAYLVEGPSAEYMVGRICDIEASSTGFGPRRAYAVAMRKWTTGSNLVNLRDAINLGILHLRETGEMEALRRKWFVARRLCPVRTATLSGLGLEDPLTLYDMAGVFYVLLAIILSTLVIAAVEIWRKGPKDQRRAGAVELRVPLHPARDAR